MNQDRFEGNWKQIKGKVREQWGKLTDDDLDVIAGKRDQLLGRIQQRHGVAKDEAERQVETFERRNPDFTFEKSECASRNPTNQRCRSLTARLHQGSPSGFGIAC